MEILEEKTTKNINGIENEINLIVAEVYNSFFLSSSVSAIKKYREVAPESPRLKNVAMKKVSVARVSNTPYSAGIKARV